MPYKTEIEHLKPGECFYFPNDPDLVIWKKLKDNRKTEKNQVFFFCEDPTGAVADYNQNRSVMAFHTDEKPAPVAPVYEQKESPVFLKPSTTAKPFPTKPQSIFMTHSVSDVPVYYTTDYKLFNNIVGNRDLDNNKIKRIIKEIDAGNDMLKYYPIQVYEEEKLLKILDGQHRFAIDKILKRPVYYVLVQEKKDDD